MSDEPKMERRTFLSILRCTEDNPLDCWTKKVINGHVKLVKDADVHARVLEICGAIINTTFIRCPSRPEETLNVQMPYLVLIMKNLNSDFAVEVQVIDDLMVRRRFRATTTETVVRAKPFFCTIPLQLEEGWNRLQLDLTDLTRRVYATKFVECLRVQIQANCRLRQVYFADRIHSEDINSFDNSLPPENSPTISQTQRPGHNRPEQRNAQYPRRSFQQMMHSE